MSTKPLLNTPPDTTLNTQVVINGMGAEAHTGEMLIDALNRIADRTASKKVPQVCYLQQMGPIETCDTCMVEVGGQARARLRDTGFARHGGADRRPTRGHCAARGV